MSEYVNQPRALKLLYVFMFVAVIWVFSCLLLWWAYDISPHLTGGFGIRSQALIAVAKMAFILALLVAASRLIEGEPKPGRRTVQTAWSLCWKGALILVGYGLVVMLHREFWKPSKGLNDGAMFLPVVGSINAPFFSEVAGLFTLSKSFPCWRLPPARYAE
jgi:hypothetical protein